MFERFTSCARQVIVLAQGEARTLRQDHVGPHHLLLGILTAAGATAGVALASLGVEADAVRRVTAATFGRGEDEPSGHIRFSEDGKKVLERSLRESLALNHTYIGTEHIALGLISDPSAETADVLATVGLDVDDARDAIMTRLGSAAGAAPAEP